MTLTLTPYADDLKVITPSDPAMILKITHQEILSKQLHLKCKPAKCDYYHSPNEDEAPIEIYEWRIPTVDKIST